MHHLEFAALESAMLETASDRAWSCWVSRVEKLIGHDLDGDQARDGYSMDFAYDAWQSGIPAAVHAQTVKDAVWAKAEG